MEGIQIFLVGSPFISRRYLGCKKQFGEDTAHWIPVMQIAFAVSEILTTRLILICNYKCIIQNIKFIYWLSCSRIQRSPAKPSDDIMCFTWYGDTKALAKHKFRSSQLVKFDRQVRYIKKYLTPRLILLKTKFKWINLSLSNSLSFKWGGSTCFDQHAEYSDIKINITR